MHRPGRNAAQFFGIVVFGHGAPGVVRCGKWPGADSAPLRAAQMMRSALSGRQGVTPQSEPRIVDAEPTTVAAHDGSRHDLGDFVCHDTDKGLIAPSRRRARPVAVPARSVRVSSFFPLHFHLERRCQRDCGRSRAGCRLGLHPGLPCRCWPLLEHPPHRLIRRLDAVCELHPHELCIIPEQRGVARKMLRLHASQAPQGADGS